jgi:hypothetical protein
MPIMQIELLSKYPMVEALVTDLRADTMGLTTTDQAIRDIREVFDRLGPYEYAKRFGLLVKESGEEFAVQFMSFFNAYSGSSTY